MESLKLLLQELSILINQNVEDNFLLYNRNEIINDWLGFEPAIDFMIKEKEDELQTKLPTSYINFLKISNGFRQVSNFTGKLYPIKKINWTKKLHPDLLEVYADHEEFDSKINNEMLKDYSAKNNLNWRYSDFTETITISDWGDGTLLMLNPNSTDKRDYEVWEFGNWFPGVIRHKNFHHFIKAKIASTKALFEV
ncbi:SMI1/KNR4 family protein [Lewinella cohaerens]|uniref:SMI1/KNR4 family protein n=1 Tax=Lewinella cohaerens TaxID=70995 RepID=UPI000380A771|nr:SMI1/KNR4 family protein [Lewinella cohaerens]